MTHKGIQHPSKTALGQETCVSFIKFVKRSSQILTKVNVKQLSAWNKHFKFTHNFNKTHLGLAHTYRFWSFESHVWTVPQKYIQPTLKGSKNVKCEKECIPAGCVPPTCWLYPSMHLAGRGGVWAGGVCLRSGVCSGVSGQGVPMGVADTPLWTEWLIDRCKNITLPQLRCGR